MIRRATLGIGVLLTGWTLAAHLLAVVPVSWTDPLLSTYVAQQVILGIGMARDSLGSYNVIVAILGLVLITWSARGASRRRRVWASAAGAGGFISGQRHTDSYSTFLADHGYAVMDIDYRLASGTVHNWDQQVGDVGCALSWIGTHTGSYGIDPSRVALFGQSAGGNLAINAAYMRATDTLHPTCGSSASMPAVRAVVGGYPAVDLTAAQQQSAVGERVSAQYLGGTPAQFPDRYRFVDSASHISSSAPPTLIYQGGADHLVRAESVQEFAADAQAAGVDVRYEVLPFLEHGAGDIAATLTPGVIAVRHLLLEWLDRHVRPAASQ